MKLRTQLIVALDVDTLAEARQLVDTLGDRVTHYKIGSQLFTSCGPAVVRFVEARGKQVFLDLKFHDIPNTVTGAVRSAVSLSVALERSMDGVTPPKKKDPNRGLFMFTVHTCGGEAMMAAAAESGAKTAEKIGVKRPLVVGVTVLTSEIKTDNIQANILKRALQARQAGLDGVVASPHEAAWLRKEFGPDFIIVTPGIRPAGSDANDQKRVATPRDAAQGGSNFIVVGRPVVQAPNPREVVDRINQELKG